MTDQNKTIPSKQCRSLDVLILRQYLEWIFLWRSWKLDNRSSAMFSHFDIVGHCFWPKESFEHLSTSVFLIATLTNVKTKPHPQFDKLYIRSELKLFIYLQLWNIDCSVTFGHPMSELPTIEDARCRNENFKIESRWGGDELLLKGQSSANLSISQEMHPLLSATSCHYLHLLVIMRVTSLSLAVILPLSLSTPLSMSATSCH